MDQELDRCLQTDFWRGKNGVLWKMAHPKIRPVGSLKSGEDQGQIPLADYYDDYALFTYAHTDDHDVRSVLTADFFVQRSGTNPTVYTQVPNLGTQAVDQAHRAGNMTSSWTLVYFVMFTALPRNAASQMYRGYLGLDIAKQEGLYSVANEPHDYDAKGVQAPACAACHATLDPLSYPYRNYNGLTGNQNLFARYVPNRLETLFGNQAATLPQVPESGVIFGQPVSSLTAVGAGRGELRPVPAGHRHRLLEAAAGAPAAAGRERRVRRHLAGAQGHPQLPGQAHAARSHPHGGLRCALNACW